MHRFTGLLLAMVLVAIVSIMLAATWRTAHDTRPHAADSHATTAELARGPQQTQASGGLHSTSTLAHGTSEPLHPIIVRKPAGPPMVELAGLDPHGRSTQVACSTCHSVRPPNFENQTSTTLDEFHQGLQVNHGKLACYACHNPANADTLRLADGSAVEYRDVMTLCSQCHAAQATSFAHGAHGGMNGYWDLSRGPQTKNNCVDCHDPHAPSYPKMIVGFKPRDRFLEGEASHDDHK